MSCPDCGSRRHTEPPLWSVRIGTDDTAASIVACDPRQAAEAAVERHPSHDPHADADAMVTVTSDSGAVTWWRVDPVVTYRARPLSPIVTPHE